METSKIYTWTLALLSLVLPLFLLPLNFDIYGLNKIILLYFTTASLVIFWAVTAYFKNEFVFRKNSFSWPLIGLLIIYSLSTLLQAPNKFTTFNNQTGIMICLAILYFIIINHLKDKKQAIVILGGLIISSVILAWLTVFTYLGFNNNIALDWVKSKAFTPTGSPLVTLTFFLVLLPATLYWAFKTQDSTAKILLFLASSLQLLGSILIMALFFNKTISFVYLLPQYGWQIAVDGFKDIRTGLLGAGPGNFSSVFNRFKPMALNNTPEWTTIFGANSNEYFNLLSTVGLLGLAFYLLLLLPNIKRANFKGALVNKVLYLMLLTSASLQLIFTNSLLTLYTTIILLALIQVVKADGLNLWENQVIRTNLKWLVTTICVIMGLIALPVFYLEARVWLGDYYFQQSVLAAQQNKGLDTYNLQMKAISFNNYSETYRLSYANTNFALANSLAAKKDLTDQDKNTINQLINQSVQEAKAVSALNPQNSNYWQNLAEIYRNLVQAASGADQWAISAYLQAVVNDPANPILRVNFGGLFYALGDYDRAIEQFKVAVNLKPDYANAYYNLAAAYKMQTDWPRAYNNLQQALNLVPIDSPDRSKAEQELAEIKVKLPSPSPTANAQTAPIPAEKQINKPEPIPSAKPGFNQITLPEEAAPLASPASSVGPSPSVSPASSPPASPAI